MAGMCQKIRSGIGWKVFGQTILAHPPEAEQIMHGIASRPAQNLNKAVPAVLKVFLRVIGGLMVRLAVGVQIPFFGHPQKMVLFLGFGF